MKKLLIIFVILGVIAAGGYYFYIQGGENLPGSENKIEKNVNTEESEGGNGASNAITGDEFTNAESQHESGDLAKEFSIEAKQFAFVPDTIMVKKGDKVRFRVTSTDVTHGLAIPQFGVNAVLEPNQEEIIEFTASEAGTYTMFCSVLCGEGHADMNGTLVVEE